MTGGLEPWKIVPSMNVKYRRLACNIDHFCKISLSVPLSSFHDSGFDNERAKKITKSKKQNLFFVSFSSILDLIQQMYSLQLQDNNAFSNFGMLLFFYKRLVITAQIRRLETNS